MMAVTKHPNETGPRFIWGKAYYWCVEKGKHVLKRWPDDPDGRPIDWDYLITKEQDA